MRFSLYWKAQTIWATRRFHVKKANNRQKHQKSAPEALFFLKMKTRTRKAQ
jgi:hypothetical protein